MASISLFFLAILASITNVLAGSRVWQPPLQPRNQTLQRRSSFVINPKSGSSIWPNKQIRYCYDNADTKSTLRPLLRAAHERWVTKGLGKDFTLLEVSDEVCQEDFTEVIRIILDSKFQTSVGYPTSNAFNPLQMHLSTDSTLGVQDVVGNIAHELGHAWGLLHEHQNRDFWDGVQNADDGEVFGPPNNGNWRCENLKDFPTPDISLVVQGGFSRPPTVEELCSDWSIAKIQKFSGGSNYLPIPLFEGVSYSQGKTGSDVNWESIMIYPSGSGGAPDASQPDGRKPILLQPDGTRIPGNEYPTQPDVDALRLLYGAEPAVPGRDIFQKVGGSTRKLFNKLFDSSKGSSSSCL